MRGEAHTGRGGVGVGGRRGTGEMAQADGILSSLATASMERKNSRPRKARLLLLALQARAWRVSMPLPGRLPGSAFPSTQSSQL